MDRLSEMFVRQAKLQDRAYAHRFDVDAFTPERRADYVRTSTLAMIAEIIEALNEIGWKPWATNRDYDAAKVISELVDAWHFMMNVMLASGIKPETLASAFFDAYVAKSERNAQRQIAGYDGVTEKCPHCHRALDDVGVIKHRVLDELAFECGHCHKTVPTDQVLGSPLLNPAIRAAKIMNRT